ncbi:MAG TPA: metallophosphoesterase [Kofleriaceae bacterium]|nr:metallophosphoesterase [Kofleriaceae bacterium]
MNTRLAAASVLVSCSLAACVRPAEERTLDDLDVGVAEAEGLAIEIEGGAAQVRSLRGDAIQLWAQAPVLRAHLTSSREGAGTVTITVENCMPGAELVARDGSGAPIEVAALGGERPTVCRFELAPPPGQETTLDLAPPDADTGDRFRFAAMGDIQTALPSVDEVFARIDQEPDLRFVFSMGDLVEDGRLDEYDLLLAQLERLDIPYFSTIGNHELRAHIDRWHDLFGRYNVHFTFKGAAFSIVDSGNASLDPLVYDWLDEWTREAVGGVHVFGTHYPPIDPIGVRQGSFRSRKEAAKLLALLAGGKVDLTLYGHIHSYYAYSNAGIPAYISGGGGALPEKFDGIGRHFLVVEVDPARGIDSVGVVRVDE